MVMELLSSSRYTYVNIDWNALGIKNGANGSSGVTVTPGVNGVNPFNPTNPNGTTNPNGNQTPQAQGPVDIQAPDTEDYQAQFNTKLGLITKYVKEYIVLDENGKEIDVNKIRKDYANKYEEGVKYCDELIESFDHDKVEKIVKAEYNKANQAKYDAGKSIADNWVEAIKSAGTEAAKLNASGVNKNNVLDVIGAFVLNEEVKDGQVSVYELFEDPKMAETLVSALKGRAQDFINRKDLDQETKEAVIAQTNELVDAKYAYTQSATEDLEDNRKILVDSYMTLAQTIRAKEAELNDAAAPKYYGVPESYGMEITNQTDRAEEEANAYNGRRRLNNNF